MATKYMFRHLIDMSNKISFLFNCFLFLTCHKSINLSLIYVLFLLAGIFSTGKMKEFSSEKVRSGAKHVALKHHVANPRVSSPETTKVHSQGKPCFVYH